ncbi:hypothetical protein BMF94_5473 [Rhodotorula taiwanensis]|uniref:Uncharacterized protein n=1 Tax=Rhodotorula taiwanensis TaxID=741276 RepID=A0A2S5B300_9BASI|nr:hypothetical protein BMF94_5473 [Rhodotorula taiwanensis]
MTGQPATIVARWPSANPLSAIPLLGRALTVSRPGTSLGRRAVQIKPYRLPAGGREVPQGRNMYVVREHDGNADRVAVFVEDPNAPTRPPGKGKSTAHKQDDDDDDDDILFVDQDAREREKGHPRWTYCSIVQPPLSTSGDGDSAPAAAALFDTFIQRALFAPPQPGGGQSTSNSREGAAAAGRSSTPQQQQQQQQQAGSGPHQHWQPRAQVISIEGFVFALASSAGATAGATGSGATAPDWIIRVGSVGLKGGAASGVTKGCILEATYVPVPYLPTGSTFARDFVLSLFPDAAVRNGEIELVEPSETDFAEAGMLDPPDADKGEEVGEWEWQGKHTLFAYVHQFKKEGIL